MADITASMREVAEGVPTVKAAYRLACELELIDRMPILKAVYMTLYEGCAVKQAVKKLMSLPTVVEEN